MELRFYDDGARIVMLIAPTRIGARLNATHKLFHFFVRRVQVRGVASCAEVLDCFEPLSVEECDAFLAADPVVVMADDRIAIFPICASEAGQRFLGLG